MAKEPERPAQPPVRKPEPLTESQRPPRPQPERRHVNDSAPDPPPPPPDRILKKGGA